MKLFDVSKIKTLPMSEKNSKISLEDIIINPDSVPLETKNRQKIDEIADKILYARENESSIILTFGAHLLRNGSSLILRRMMEEGLATHLASNGACSIHDWEFAYAGKALEDVRHYIKQGQFGLWEEAGKYINLALKEGALEGRGYGESIGKMINSERVGNKKVPHPFKEDSIQQGAFVNNIPFTIHPSLGQDIIYEHPLCDFGNIGKTAQVDFLRFTESVSNLNGGVYLSIGSAIMSPMIFEKTLSMSRNVAHQQGKKIDNFSLVVNDIQESGNWKWGSGIEPKSDNPAYYLRFCKTFDRVGAKCMDYIQEDNSTFLHNLYSSIKNKE